MSLNLKAKGITATGYESKDGFVVVAGSQAVTETVPSIYEYLTTIRNDLIRKKILVDESGRLVLKQDHVFTSASNAASVLLGRNSNGRMEWKDADGRSIKQRMNDKDPDDVLKSKLKRIKNRIAKIERFEVAIEYQGDPESLATYDYQVAANKDLNVAQWRDGRFAKLFPECQVTVLLQDGSEAHGAMKLGNVRDSYLE